LSDYVRPLDTHTGLILSIYQMGNTYHVVGTVLQLDTGAPVAQISKSCDVCQIKEGIAMMDSAAAALSVKAKADLSVPEVVQQPSPPPPPSGMYRPDVRISLLVAGILAGVAGAFITTRPAGGLGGAVVLGAGGLMLGSSVTLFITAPESSP
jgi:hypothetical protein